MGKMDSTKFKTGATGEKVPKGADKADSSGERHGKIIGGVAQGMEDKTGADKLFNTGRTSGVCYVKEKAAYR